MISFQDFRQTDGTPIYLQIVRYIRQGLALRALRPLNSLAPCFVLAAGCAARDPVPVWVAMPGYRIVPPEVGDTMALPAAYSLFRKDVAEMLDRVYK